MIGLGMSGLSAAGNAISVSQQAAMQEEMLAQQAHADALELAERERAAQESLAKTLSAQNNLFAARGVSGSTGSPLAAANQAEALAERRMTSLMAANLDSIYATKRASMRRSRSGAIAGSLLDFGTDAYGIWSGRNRIGRL